MRGLPSPSKVYVLTLLTGSVSLTLLPYTSYSNDVVSPPGSVRDAMRLYASYVIDVAREVSPPVRSATVWERTLPSGSYTVLVRPVWTAPVTRLVTGGSVSVRTWSSLSYVRVVVMPPGWASVTSVLVS